MDSLLTDIMMSVAYFLIMVTVSVTIVSAIRSIKLRGRANVVVNGIPTTKIFLITVALLLLSMIVTFMLGSTEMLRVNGEPYSNRFWLRTADMFIFTSVVLILVAILAIVYGISGLNRNSR